MFDPRPGDKVTYVPIADSLEKGIVKSMCEDHQYVFVVYKCADDWNNYQDYTGQRTDINDLIKGWRQ